MRFWVDAQLPKALAPWLNAQFGVEAATLEVLHLRHASDEAIFAALRKPGEVIISKDEDFVDMVARMDPPPQILWVTCGNVTNRALRALFTNGFPTACRLLEAGEPVVELASEAK